MNFINFITIFIPLNFMAMYFLIKARNVYFFIPIGYIFYIKIYNLVNKSYDKIPMDYKNIREKYIPKTFNLSFDKTFLMDYLDGPRRLRVSGKKNVIIFVISIIFIFIITNLYGKKILINFVELLIYMATIILVLYDLMSLYYDIKSYKKYIEIYGGVEKEIDKFLILKSVLYLLIELFAIVLMRMRITRLYRPRRRY